MISKIFGKKQEDKTDNELKEKISNMNLSDLVLYVKEKNTALEVSDEGIVFVLERLISKINEDRYFLDKSDDDTKIKRAFDLILTISKSRYVTIKAIELIAEFINLYESIIKEYDKKHKEIYEDRLKKSIDNAMVIIDSKVALQNKMNVLD
jgi:L-rhamnose mutarotase